MIERIISEYFKKTVGQFPVVVLTGPRQAGKSTLCKTLLKDTHGYVTLEDPDTRQRALDDPRTFLKAYPPPVILDEIQYAPELPSYIQGIVDANRDRYGQYVLTGSQNFLMMQKVSQSLAGRAALISLWPCSVVEVDAPPSAPRTSPEAIADWILRGGYPELRARPDLDRKTWCGSYIRLYLERDVRQLVNVGDLDTFERFLRLAAGRTGQLLNMSDLSRDAGISVPTAKRWLSVLQASYQVVLLQPYFANLSKRLVKSPKIYFGDTALAAYLMGIHDPEVLLKGPSLGALFETAVILEHIKQFTAAGDVPPLTFFRTQDGLEADVVIEKGLDLSVREVKSSRTLSPSTAGELIKIEGLLKRRLDKSILAPVSERIPIKKDVYIRHWADVMSCHANTGRFS